MLHIQTEIDRVTKTPMTTASNFAQTSQSVTIATTIAVATGATPTKQNSSSADSGLL